MKNGDVTGALKGCDHVVEGEVRIGGQEHFYLETNGCISVPLEDGEIEVFSSTQNPLSTQTLVASALGVPASRVACRVKRMGMCAYAFHNTCSTILILAFMQNQIKSIQKDMYIS